MKLFKEVNLLENSEAEELYQFAYDQGIKGLRRSEAVANAHKKFGWEPVGMYFDIFDEGYSDGSEFRTKYTETVHEKFGINENKPEICHMCGSTSIIWDDVFGWRCESCGRTVDAFDEAAIAEKSMGIGWVEPDTGELDLFKNMKDDEKRERKREVELRKKGQWYGRRQKENEELQEILNRKKISTLREGLGGETHWTIEISLATWDRDIPDNIQLRDELKLLVGQLTGIKNFSGITVRRN